MYSPPPNDDDAQRLTAAHAAAAAALDATTTGDPVWGWHGRTLGRRADHPVHGACWLRLLSAPSEKASGKLWDGTELAGRLFTGVHKPALHALHDATAHGHAYRAELTEFIDDPVLSPQPVLRHELELTDPWFKSIRTDLDTIATVATDREAVRQQWIDRAVPTYTGVPAPRITEWTCSHGDFHASNITTTGVILDWEGFGLAPRGWDQALLYAYSLLAPATAACIRAEFAHILDTEAGRTAQLAVAADLLQSASRGDHPELITPLQALVTSLTEQ